MTDRLRLRYLILVEAPARGVPRQLRLKKGLKYLGRVCDLPCVWAREVPPEDGRADDGGLSGSAPAGGGQGPHPH